MDGIDNNGAQKPHQDVQDRGKDESSNSIGLRIIILFWLENGTSLVFSLGIRILILISIGEKVILDSHWFMKDEGAIDWEEGFPTSIGQGEQSQGGVLEAYQEREGYLVFSWKEKEEKESMEKILVLMWEKVLFMKRKNMCKQEHGRKLCVTSTWSEVHRRISMTKPLDF